MKSWKPARPHTVTLRDRGLECAAIGPVCQSQRVVSLDLSRNKLRALPDDINVPNLRELDVSYNSLQALPQEIDAPALERLDLSHNQIATFPNQLLLLLTKLVDLDLSHNSLQALPQDIDAPALERLDLSHNQIATLPNQLLLLLPKLVDLDLSHNSLQALPVIDQSSVAVVDVSNHGARFPCLSRLDLSHNDLRDVAPAMKQLCGRHSQLESVGLKGNVSLKLPPSQILERGPVAVCQFFKDLSRGRQICWSQTVLVVGQEEAGKTALCRALSGHRCADHAQMTEGSTVGIDIVPWSTVVATPRNKANRSTHRKEHVM